MTFAKSWRECHRPTWTGRDIEFVNQTRTSWLSVEYSEHGLVLTAIDMLKYRKWQADPYTPPRCEKTSIPTHLNNYNNKKTTR